MAVTIGAVTCTLVKGTASSLRQRVVPWFSPGVRGQFGLKLGFSEGEFAFTAIKRDSVANVKTWKAALEGIQGTVVTITDDWGDQYVNCLILEVRASPTWRTPLLGGTDGALCRGEIPVRGVVVA